MFARQAASRLRFYSTAMNNSSNVMQAVVIEKTGTRDQLKYVPSHPLPAYSSTQALVKVAYNSVCYRDLIDRSGGFPFIKLPAILGHELSGEVVAVGVDVGQLKVGDRVVSLHWSPCGECLQCINNHETLCEDRYKSFLGLTNNGSGGYAAFAAVGETGLVKIPAKFSLRDASAVMCTYGTVYHTLFVRAQLKPSHKVFISGASGGVGSAAVQMCKANGNYVVAMTTSDKKEDYIRSLGADDVVVAPRATIEKGDAHRLSEQFDVSFDCVGRPTFMTSLRALRPGGTLAFVGNVDVGKASLPLGLCVVNELRLVGGDSIRRKELEECFEFLLKHSIRPKFHAELPLSQAKDAHRMLEEREVRGRIVLQCQDKREAKL